MIQPVVAMQSLGPRMPRVGLLGAAKIAPKALVAPAPGLIVLQAVAARSPERARDFAGAHGFLRHAASYADLIESDDIDVVYIALPAALHAGWVEAALRSGKHVLVEKPFGLSATEARLLVALARTRGLLLMEAHHWRYHPLVTTFADELSRLGEVSHVEMVFNGAIAPGDIRLEPALGAGVLLDFGCYLIQWQAFVTGDASPEIIRAVAVTAAAGVDVAVEAELRAQTGTRVGFSCDMRPHVTFRAAVTVTGSRGVLHFENPLVTEGSFLDVRTDAGSARYEGKGVSTYRNQLEVLVDALRTGSAPPTSGENIIQTQCLLDALVAASGLPARSQLAGDALGSEVLSARPLLS